MEGKGVEIGRIIEREREHGKLRDGISVPADPA